MIFVAGLSPAWQRMLQFPSLKVGEVNRAASVHECASGKPINVAIALAHLGVEHQLTTVLGGESGAAIRRELDSLGVSDSSIETRSATRTCTTLLCDDGPTTELVEEARPIAEDEFDAFLASASRDAATADVVVFTGSVPAGIPADLWSRMLAATSAKAILDIRGQALTAALPQRPFVVKPNREELGQTVGRSLSTEAELLAAMEEVHGLGAQWVVVTSGADAVYACGDAGCFKAIPPRVKVVNAIGSGDCFAAALAWRTSLGETLPQSLRWALAAASHNVEHLLPARLRLERVEELAAEARIDRIR